MCEPPARPWREFLRPQRMLLFVVSCALMVTGIVTRSNATGLTLIGLGAAVLLAAVVTPAITEIEFGFPSGVKVTAAARDREENLHRAFDEQRPDLELCAKLLCDDPATAAELLNAAMARATLGWRGPVSGEIRAYVLCWFVHRLMAHSHLAGRQPPAMTDAAHRLLSGLPPIQRIAVVLSEFADLGIEEIAGMVGVSPAELDAQLRQAETVLNAAATPGRDV